PGGAAARAVRAGCGRGHGGGGGDGAGWPCHGRIQGAMAGRGADAEPADVAEVVARRLVAGRAGRHRYPFLTRTVLVALVASAIPSAAWPFSFSRTVPAASSTTSTTLASNRAVSSLPA